MLLKLLKLFNIRKSRKKRVVFRWDNRYILINDSKSPDDIRKLVEKRLAAHGLSDEKETKMGEMEAYLFSRFAHFYQLESEHEGDTARKIMTTSMSKKQFIKWIDNSFKNYLMLR